MIKPEKVPQAAWLAMRDQMREGIRNEATLIAAALNVWPGMHFIGNIGVHLPLPTENSDE